MHLRFLISVMMLLITSLSQAQVMGKVKRKGVKPINVTKPVNQNYIYSLDQFNGKWQEVSRRDRANNSVVDFNDTLFFIFSGDDVLTRNGTDLSLKGKAELEPGNILNTGADEF